MRVQRLEQSRSAISGGAASEAQYDAICSRIQRREHELTDPEGAGLHRSARFGGNPLEPGGFRHLNEGRAVAQPTPRSGAVLPVRVAHLGLTAFAISGSQDGGQRTLRSEEHTSELQSRENL